MEAVPRLPMVGFQLRPSTDNVSFGLQLKQYIASFYGEDPESYNTEINNLERLRGAAVRPTIDVSGCQLLKKYYCQLHFLKSRFPMSELQAAAVYFSWKDTYSGMACSVPDIRFELMCILYNIGALHSQLGALDSRTNPEGMKMACTHFQCAAWAFQTIKESFYQVISYLSSVEVISFMQEVCFAQAQECILEKSMMDNRKATIISKIAVQVVDYYKRSLSILQMNNEENSISDFIVSKQLKEWTKYLNLKISYYKSISLLFQGQQAEEQQKMGERVAFYQAACEQLDESRKIAAGFKDQKEVIEAIAFTTDVVEGKRKAAKNENEFIYHEEVPSRDSLQEVKGASLVKGIPFNINDPEVSGTDIFSRLVPMEAHEASSLYSEKKAQLLRQLGELVESKDQALVEFLSSMQLDFLNKMKQANGIPQELIDRAAELSAKPMAIMELNESMNKLTKTFNQVQSMLDEIKDLLKLEEENEKSYQELMGKRPPSIIATEMAREAAKYQEAHHKANESNRNLNKAIGAHVANLQVLSQPLMQLKQKMPSVDLTNPNINEAHIKELESLLAKVDEMKTQRVMLWSQLRDSVHNDDITNVLVTRQADQTLDQLFQQELQKHQQLASLIEQNVAAQENILKAIVEAYANAIDSRRYIQEMIAKRNSTISALITSYDTYEELLGKANKGIEFYTKLETNVSKLLQRIKGACKVQDEEREQILTKNCVPSTTVANVEIPSVPVTTATVAPPTPKLKDYLDARKTQPQSQYQPNPMHHYQPQLDVTMTVRPAPLGSEINEPILNKQFNEQLVDRMAALYKQNYVPQQQYVMPQRTPTPNYEVTKADTSTTDSYRTISSTVTNYNYTQMDSVGNYQATQPQTYVYPQYPNDPNIYYPPGYGVPQMSNIIPPTTQQMALTGYTIPQMSNVIPPTTQQMTPTNYNMPQLSNVIPPTTQQMMPSGYVMPPTSNVVDSSSAQPMSPHVIEYASSVRPDTFIYSSTYSSPLANMKSMNTVMPNYMTTHDTTYRPVEMNQQYQNYDGAYHVTMSTANQQPIFTKESNVDLLSGLDFNLSQIPPLIPQQTSLPEPKKEEPKIEKVPPKMEEEKKVVPQKMISITKKMLDNPDVTKLFEIELDKFEKFVETLNNRTLNGPTNLESKWKEIQDKQDGQKKAMISVARCYPNKNRLPDILPYDHSRVELKTLKDDYINASYVDDVCDFAPKFIVTQHPLPNTLVDFWTMIKENNVEIIVCLVNDNEIKEEDIYWPRMKGRDLNLNTDIFVSLKSEICKTHWVERLITITETKTRKTKTVMHLQFISWPGSLFPTTPEPFISYVREVISLYYDQKNYANPVLVHCYSGIGKSGLFCLLMVAILQVTNNSNTLPDLSLLTSKLTVCRKNILRDREHLKFAHEAFLFYMKLILSQGQTKKRLNEVKIQPTIPVQIKKEEIREEEPNLDPLSSLDPFWTSKK